MMPPSPYNDAYRDALRGVDEELKSISVFVMTTSSEEQDKVAAYDLNVAGYILKPLSFESFVQATSILRNFWGLCEHL